ncbi:MAG: response regulator [Planctomycetes bacterium]|nr:response regulator [Planctomycetota bacterium]
MTVLPRTVLLVDDNVSLRQGLAMLLEDEGCETLQAGRGDEAIALAQRAPCRLVVLDLNLPDMTGVRVYSEINRAMKELACIFMTAEAGDDLIEDALRLNPLRLLRKPFEVNLFRDLVRRAIA